MLPGSLLTQTVSLARERSLPVHPALAPVFGPSPDATGVMPGLIRGHTVACMGSAAVSCALALAVAPTRAGSWVGVVGIPQIGIAAAQHLGVALERTMFITVPEPATVHCSQETAPSAQQSKGTQSSNTRADLIGALSALVDGVDMVIMARRLVTSLPSSVIRRLQARSQSRGTVLLIVGDPGSVSVDLRLMARTEHWQGIGVGHGHLQRRLVALELDGRRCGRVRRHSLWLPSSDGALSSEGIQAEASTSNTHVPANALSDSGVVIALRRTG